MSNLNSKHGSRYDNISIAISLLIDSKIKIKKISNFYETPSYPNNNFPKFLNVGLSIEYKYKFLDLFKIIKKLKKNLVELEQKKWTSYNRY